MVLQNFLIRSSIINRQTVEECVAKYCSYFATYSSVFISSLFYITLKRYEIPIWFFASARYLLKKPHVCLMSYNVSRLKKESEEKIARYVMVRAKKEISVYIGCNVR